MAIYIGPQTYWPARTSYNEVGCDLQFVQGPPMLAAPWTNVLLYYFAMQVDFKAENGDQVGGGHFGIQVYDHFAITKKTVANWGVYDDILGGGATFRSSRPLSSAFSYLGENQGLSFGYDFDYGDWIRFRCFKSPKQNYVAAEIIDGAGQVPPYVGTDQQPDEVAYRVTVQNVTRQTLPVPMNDCLIKNPAADRAMANGMCWLEPLSHNGSDLDSLWNYDPICRYRNICFDGYRNMPYHHVTYAAGATNCDARAQATYFEMRGNVTRTVAHGTDIAFPAEGWDAALPNVAPNPSLDSAPRSTTPRPWF